MDYLSGKQILATARDIAEQYAADDLKLTLRQLYYQFVSRGLIESSQEAYKRIGNILCEARYDGDFPMDALEDRGREVSDGDFTDCYDRLDTAERQCAAWFRDGPENSLMYSRWYRQPIHVSVWVEKEALAGVFAEPCEELGVSMFACKGYPSVSALWSWIEKVEAAHRVNEHTEARILYFGDHDPDGLEIPQSSLRGIQRLCATYESLDGIDIKMDRIALTEAQIRQYNPPPFPAKETSTRFKKYLRDTGLRDAWELDALNPRVLRDLITSSVGACFDTHIFRQNEETIAEKRDELRERLSAPGWAADALAWRI